ncbi:MAG: hypothetical protein U0270_35570 [Labilithrix sp.]
MRSFGLACMLVSVSLVACVTEGADEESSSDQDLTAADSGPVWTDASVSSDAGPAIDSGPVWTDASVSSDAGPAIDSGPVVTDASVPSVPTYANVAPIINSVCGHCHASKFSTLEKVKANKSRMFSLINSGRMPKNNPGWRNTADGQDVLDFLAESPELQ